MSFASDLSKRPSIGDRVMHPWWLTVLLLTMAPISALILVTSNGNPALALAPMLAIGGIFMVLRVRLRYSFALLLFCVLLFHNPSSRPMEGLWQGPLYPLGSLLYKNLRHLVGVDALRFSLIELLLACLLGVTLVRTFGGNNVDRQRTWPAAPPLKWALLLSLGAVLLWIAIGIARNGDFRQMLWQTRQFLWIPFIAVLAMRAFKSPSDYRALAGCLMAVAVLRILEGLYFNWSMVRPQGLFLEYIITHDDSILFATCVTIIVTTFLESRHKVRWLLMLGVAPVIAIGMVVNSRRLVYVGVAGALFTIYGLIRSPIRSQINRVLVTLLPIGILYFILGTYSDSPIFGPVHSLTSIANPGDISNRTRDIENANLVVTLTQNPLFGSGFGHEYIERVVAYSVAEAMPNYRYLAHNSVLWLISLTGWLGFTLIWLYMPVAVFLAVRSYALSEDPTSRITALCCVAVIVIYLIQCYGDMGAISWMGAFVLGTAIGCIGSLATRCHAWRRAA